MTVMTGEIREWLPVILMLFGAGAAWGLLRGVVKRIAEQLADVKASVAKFESTIITVAMLQQSVALVTEQVDRVRTSIHDLRENKLSEFALQIAKLEGTMEQIEGMLTRAFIDKKGS